MEYFTDINGGKGGKMFQKKEKATGLLMLIMGAILLLWPGMTVLSVCSFLGWCLVIGGAVEIILGLTGNRSAAGTAGGAVSVIAGIVLAARPGAVVSVLPVLIGLALAAAGIALLVNVIAGHSAGVLSTMQIIGGTITLIVGLILLFHPFGSVKFLTALLGIVLIYYGILFLGR